jgi:hypothetical protein
MGRKSIQTRSVRFTAAVAFAFAAPLALSVAFSSCHNNSNNGDAAADGAGGGPCEDGTIVLADCEPVDGMQAEAYTDEACMGLDTAVSRSGIMHDDTQAPAIDAPTEGAVLPNMPPYTFRWHPTGLSYLQRTSPAPRAFRPLDDLDQWMRLVPVAEAHCTPFGGVGYSLSFSADSQTLLQVETANTTYTPDANAWSRLRAARGTISFVIGVARYSDNTVTVGPFDQATPRTFTISP